MGRHVVRLTPDLLGPVLERGLGVADPDRARAWLSLVLREWGSAGRVVLLDDDVAACAVYAPAEYFPSMARLPSGPVSADAVLLRAIAVAPELRRRGLGRLLVQAAARDLIGRGEVHAIEAFGAKPVPTAFWARTGFRTEHAHVRTPRMRMDLRTTLTWKDEVEAAVGRLLTGLRPRPAGGPQAVNSSSSFKITDLGRAPTMVRTTSPPW